MKKVLDDLTQNIRELVAQRLRSKAIFITCHAELILKSRRPRTPKTIHETIARPVETEKQRFASRKQKNTVQKHRSVYYWCAGQITP